MNKKLILILLSLFVLQVFFFGVASAAYDESGDIVVEITVAPELVETSSSTGETTFETQESLHYTITDSTGQEVDHSYVWIYVNGEPVLAVDPPKAFY